MYNINLISHNFRNLKDELLKIDSSPVTILYGKNGSGKTNYLEALSVFSLSRGIRQCPFSRMIRLGSHGYWEINMDIQNSENSEDNGDFKVSYRLNNNIADSARGQRSFYKDNEKATQKRMRESGLRMLYITPGNGNLVAKDSSERRRFVDDLASQLDDDHSARVRSYSNLVLARSKHLFEKNVAGFDKHWLDVVEEEISLKAVSLISTRVEVIARINKLAEGFKDLLPSCCLLPSSELITLLEEKPATEVEEFTRNKLMRSRAADKERGRLTFAPAKIALDMEINSGEGNILSEFASTGEQMLSSLTLLYAAGLDIKSHTGRMPFLLMDDILTHLDADNRKKTAKVFKNLGAKIFLTGPELSIFSDWSSYSQYIEVKSGANAI